MFLLFQSFSNAILFQSPYIYILNAHQLFFKVWQHKFINQIIINALLNYFSTYTSLLPHMMSLNLARLLKFQLSLFLLDQRENCREMMERVSCIYLLLLLSILARKVNTFVLPLKFSETETLVSPGGVFELGIFKPATDFREKGRWYLGIWHVKFRSSIVWVANRDDPLSSPIGNLTVINSNLFLLDSNGVTVWSSKLRIPLKIKSLVVVQELLDNGNFVLGYRKDPQQIVWQSFDFPTDNLFDGMSLGWDSTMNVDRRLTPWKTAVDPSSKEGLYYYTVRKRQAFMLKYGQEWYRTDPHYVTVLETPDESSYQWKVSMNTTSMLKIDSTGMISMFVWRTDELDILWTSPFVFCDMYSACGANQFCYTTINVSSHCNCLQGFQKIQELCVRKFPLSCHEDEFLEMKNMKLPDLEYAAMDMKFVALDACKGKCIKDCSCSAFAIIDMPNGRSTCVTWVGDLRDMRLDSIMGQSLFIKLAAKDRKEDSSNNTKTTWIITTVGLILIVILIFLFYRKRSLIAKLFRTQINDNEGWKSQRLDYLTISLATENFSDSNKIGEGGFGSVYKGRFLDGTEIAVKKLTSLTDKGMESFDNEVRIISRIQHTNIVRLEGYFSAGNERILVYEYLHHKGLDNFIFDTTRRSRLNWKSRFEITSGIARGLLYLHEDSRFKIIHLDIKPSNLLLGNDMNPKISDFGMAKTLEKDQTEDIASKPAGTRGYMAPEFLTDKIYSVKSDVYSYGVMLLEIVSGIRNTSFAMQNDGVSLLSYIWQKWTAGNVLDIVDPVLKDSTETLPEEQVCRCIQVGLLCIQQHPQDRPTMWSVLAMLRSETELIGQPKPPVNTITIASSEEELDAVTNSNFRVSFSALTGR